VENRLLDLKIGALVKSIFSQESLGIIIETREESCLVRWTNTKWRDYHDKDVNGIWHAYFNLEIINEAQ
jgi:hypothetical protein